MHLYRRFLHYVKPYRLLDVAASLSFVLSGFLGAYRRLYEAQFSTTNAEIARPAEMMEQAL
ncbi:MAG: hypothetical protein ACP5JG_12920 [Anaerolineae bacterium]